MGRVCGAVQNTPRHLVIYHRARVAAPLTACALVCMRVIERGGDIYIYYICMWDAYGVTYGGVVEIATFTVTGAFGGYTPLSSYMVQVEVAVQRNFCLCLLVVAAAAVANSISIASRKQTKEDSVRSGLPGSGQAPVCSPP